MEDGKHVALQQLARADVVQLRVNGLILQVLIERGLLDREQAAALLADAAKFLRPDDPMQEVFRGLIAEFQ